MDETDFILVKAVGTGDHRAYETLVKKHQGSVFNFVRRILGDRHAAEDVVQEVFWALYRSAPGFQPRAKVSTWLFTIAYNLSINEIKRRKRLLNLQGSLSGCLCTKSGPDALEAAQTAELEGDVAKALEQLPENQRAALLLRVHEELTYREISEILDVSVSSVESLIFRGRARMRELLRGQRKD